MPASDYNLGGIPKIVAGSARPGLIFLDGIHFPQVGILAKRPLGKNLWIYVPWLQKEAYPEDFKTSCCH